MSSLFKLGFGFVEVGTITPRPQKGNPKPRLFRLSEDQAIINRFGFNNDGCDVVAERLKAYGESLAALSQNCHPACAAAGSRSWQGERKNETQPLEAAEPRTGSRDSATLRRRDDNIGGTTPATTTPEHVHKPILGVNIGKNKETENALDDYLIALEKLAPYADYMTINISSPNTAGLRALQSSQALSGLLNPLKKRAEEIAPNMPLLLKIAPDLTREELAEICAIVIAEGIDGLIVSNTTLDRPASLQSFFAGESGGLSGKPLLEKSTDCLKFVADQIDGRIPLIGVGGIFTPADAKAKLTAGASLVQVYSGLIYQGPGLVKELISDLN